MHEVREGIRVDEALGIFAAPDVSLPQTEFAIRAERQAAQPQFNAAGQDEHRNESADDPAVAVQTGSDRVHGSGFFRVENSARSRIALTPEDLSDGQPVMRNPFVATVGQPAQTRPAGWGEQPAESDDAVSFAEGFHLADDASIGKDAVDDAHQFLAGRVINRRVEAG